MSTFNTHSSSTLKFKVQLVISFTLSATRWDLRLLRYYCVNIYHYQSKTALVFYGLGNYVSFYCPSNGNLRERDISINQQVPWYLLLYRSIKGCFFKFILKLVHWEQYDFNNCFNICWLYTDHLWNLMFTTLSIESFPIYGLPWSDPPVSYIISFVQFI